MISCGAGRGFTLATLQTFTEIVTYILYDGEVVINQILGVLETQQSSQIKLEL